MAKKESLFTTAKKQEQIAQEFAGNYERIFGGGRSKKVDKMKLMRQFEINRKKGMNPKGAFNKAVEQLIFIEPDFIKS